MKNHEAVHLLDKTFTNEFDMNQFARFIKELFNDIEIRFTDKTSYVPNQFQEYISELFKIGYYENNRQKMEILIVKLIKTSSRDRARTMQRNFIAHWLGKVENDAALVAFYGEDPEDWRFSFVKMEYNLVRNEEGKVIIAKELTPAKRYSYLVGVNEPNHTCRSQFLDLITEEEKNPTLVDIENAFSIDNVTKEFFEKYKELVVDLRESLDKIVAKDRVIQKEFSEKSIDTIDFSKKLLGQIVFIYFLQKKGWLGVGKNADGTFKDWGTGPRNFLRKLYKKDLKNYDNFFNDILEPLFYDALATPRDNNYYTLFKCKIPFLNGGLFEPINDYDWTGTDILLHNRIFGKILDTFDRFNFTVKEDEPLEKEVAVDPEMLGKVFENLLGIKERKDKGAFYTPREIVYYMCQQSLINYLETNTSIPKEDIEKFIQYGDLALDQTIRALEQEKKYSGKTFNIKEENLLPATITENYIIIDTLLQEIKIVDPAVGSGAFPVGMMNEIVKARSILSIFFDKDEQEERTEYNLKREAIENCLYGVDIDPSAVEIAKLRFWLSLIVDEMEITKIKPLPNLDHKIICGNSLLEEFEGFKLFDDKLLGQVRKDKKEEILAVNNEIDSIRDKILSSQSDKEIKKLELMAHKLKKKRLEIEKRSDTEQITLFETESEKKIKQLKALQNRYFNEQSRKNKRQIRGEIERIEWDLIETTLTEQGHQEALKKLEQYKRSQSKPFFLWKLYFAEVFQRENPGFDVVIANPPYIQLQKAHDISDTLSNAGYETYSKAGDIYCIFYEKSLRISRENGVSTLITSNSWLRTQYGKLLRKFLIKNSNPIQLVDFEDAQLFETAIVETNILIFEKAHWNSNLLAVTVKNDFTNYHSLWNYVVKNKVILSNLDASSWSIGNATDFALKQKIESGSTLLGDLDINIYFGIKTGFNKAFIIDGEKKKQLIRMNQENSHIIQPLLRGRDVKKYSHTFNDIWLINTHNGVKREGIDRIDVQKDYTTIFRYLKQYQSQLVKRRDKGKHWSNLRNCAYLREFNKDKIIWGELSDRPKFSLDMEGYFAEATLFFMTGENLKYLLAILNSMVSEWYFNQISTSSGMGTNRWKKYKIELLPIKLGSSEIHSSIVSLVEKILSSSKKEELLHNQSREMEVRELEKKINKIIFTLYELSPDEIKIIEEFCQSKDSSNMTQESGN